MNSSLRVLFWLASQLSLASKLGATTLAHMLWPRQPDSVGSGRLVIYGSW